ncbi:hypothetical protein Taro_055225, partial [Colocasia esculenta]|nr:hypothetical protein [Colocasia esculenta]
LWRQYILLTREIKGLGYWGSPVGSLSRGIGLRRRSSRVSWRGAMAVTRSSSSFPRRRKRRMIWKSQEERAMVLPPVSRRNASSAPWRRRRGGCEPDSYDEAEALTEEMEEESLMIGEVMRIKEIVANQDDEPDSLLFESLRRLQLMGISVETLKATEIGKAVNGLRKHHLKEIRHLVQMLIDLWEHGSIEKRWTSLMRKFDYF